MANKPEPPKTISRNVYKIAKKAIWLGAVEALGSRLNYYSQKRTTAARHTVEKKFRASLS
jgi:hypothetical protein